ncbi:alpha-tubulin [Naegleria gruberi]|uniref:Alpha-tubulin n=1 Tax=Naegleria gruberi TaxID=5762 RepID=D2VT78_NAEGR|nr:alpha-tubulin [Naegleria gruberi]EFC40099.1 alpha-tubulin [Naegleria gruberi]|eukprot:XP_002672843.1 alpha-tubulin [Naegleria gruberi]
MSNNNSGELIFIHLGECGCQIGKSIWDLFCNTEFKSNTYQLFEESIRKENTFTSRSLFIDSDSNIIDHNTFTQQIRLTHCENKLKYCCKQENIINDYESSITSLRSQFSFGNNYINYIEERIRKMVENCDHLDGIIFTHSIGGGTGSGMICRILEQLRSKSWLKGVTISSFSVFPSLSEMASSTTFELYNMVLSMETMREYLSNISSIRNDLIYDYCKYELKIENIEYNTINQVISQMISTFLEPCLFSNESFSQISSKLVPYPSMNIISNSLMSIRNNLDCKELFSNQYSLTIDGIDNAKSISTCISMRGTDFYNINKDSIANYLNHRKLIYQNVFNSQRNIGNACKLFNSNNIVHIANNSTGVRNNLEQYLKLFDTNFKKYTYIQKYVLEGLADGEFEQARENLESYIDDYKELDRDYIYNIIHKKKYPFFN